MYSDQEWVVIVAITQLLRHETRLTGLSLSRPIAHTTIQRVILRYPNRRSSFAVLVIANEGESENLDNILLLFPRLVVSIEVNGSPQQSSPAANDQHIRSCSMRFPRRTELTDHSLQTHSRFLSDTHLTSRIPRFERAMLVAGDLLGELQIGSAPPARLSKLVLR